VIYHPEYINLIFLLRKKIDRKFEENISLKVDTVVDTPGISRQVTNPNDGSRATATIDRDYDYRYYPRLSFTLSAEITRSMFARFRSE